MWHVGGRPVGGWKTSTNSRNKGAMDCGTRCPVLFGGIGHTREEKHIGLDGHGDWSLFVWWVGVGAAVRI